MEEYICLQALEGQYRSIFEYQKLLHVFNSIQHGAFFSFNSYIHELTAFEDAMEKNYQPFSSSYLY
jgi:hypothetical protein